MTDELHARPFSPLTAPAELMHFAFSQEDAPASDRAAAALQHLNQLLAFFGAPLVGEKDGRAPSFHVVEAADLRLKWERHTEFVSLTIIAAGDRGETPFSPWMMERLPQDWFDSAPGPVVSSALVRVQGADSAMDARTATERLSPYFDASSVACAHVIDKEALVMSDFRLDPADFVRFAIIAEPEIGPRRLGRIAQRLIEIETYRAVAMLALPQARRLSPRLSDVDQSLSGVAATIARPAPAASELERQAAERATLDSLTELAAQLEAMKAESAFRFDAARAYEAIIWERLAAIREDRFSNRQTLTEFMVRRFKPAMRTCSATAERLNSLSDRVGSAANLLRTRVDVSLEAQNQKLLASMDRRAKLQLRLQETVEGLSIVAISYYALNLAAYAVKPLGLWVGLSEKQLYAALVAPVVLMVWLMLRGVKKRMSLSESKHKE
ncbi:MAG: DUF3422 domain-containing protein [Neomegalonema sp.]|nr:DUF3422 domain-containing protein [Neomegalonema sp.]